MYQNHLLKPALPGVFFAILTLIFGFSMGIVFGANEDAIKDRMKHSAQEVRTSVYQSDDAEIKKVLDKSWTYMKRAHMHAGGMGASALGLILVLALLTPPSLLLRGVSLGLGLGGLGYSIFWMIAGFMAPGLGGTSAAKEALKFLAMPTSGAFVVSTFAVAAFVLWRIFKKAET